MNHKKQLYNIFKLSQRKLSQVRCIEIHYGLVHCGYSCKGQPYFIPHILHHLIYPIEGLAVPTFFVISAFLFFSKLRKQPNQFQSIAHYEKRLLVLYVFWTIVWMPILLMQRTEYRHSSVFHGICLIVKNLFKRHFRCQLVLCSITNWSAYYLWFR